MDHPLLTSLGRSFELTSVEQVQISKVPFRTNDILAHQDIVREGDRPTRCVFIVEGLAATSKLTAEGKRQTMAFHIAGDMPDLLSMHLNYLDSDIRSVSPCRVAFIEHGALRTLCNEAPRVAEALWRHTLVDASIFREWVVNVGTRKALKRLAHLFCEIVTRLKALGLSTEGSCLLVLTQSDLGEATGLSVVHVNRMMQELRSRELISFDGQSLTVQDWPGLVALAGFADNYLHLRGSSLASK